MRVFANKGLCGHPGFGFSFPIIDRGEWLRRVKHIRELLIQSRLGVASKTNIFGHFLVLPIELDVDHHLVSGGVRTSTRKFTYYLGGETISELGEAGESKGDY